MMVRRWLPGARSLLARTPALAANRALFPPRMDRVAALAPAGHAVFHDVLTEEQIQSRVGFEGARPYARRDDQTRFADRTMVWGTDLTPTVGAVGGVAVASGPDR